MIMDKGSFTWNISRQLELNYLNLRIAQLEAYIKKKGLRVPKSPKQERLAGGYNTDDEE